MKEYEKEYSTDLFNNVRAVIPHSIHDRESSISTRRTRRFRGYGERIYQGLRVVFANIRQEMEDVSTYIRTGCLNASNNLTRS